MKRLIIFVSILLNSFLFSQNLVINEIMSSNSSVLADEDGDFPDWIEIYNPTDSEINLNNYSLSDNLTSLKKWTFPERIIQPKDFLIVFASDKNRKPKNIFWETIIDKGDNWRYLIPISEPSSLWRTTNFDDSQWKIGPSGFGYGDNDDATIVQNCISVFVRHTFQIDDVNNIDTAYLHIDFDDAFVAYINGVEIARDNIGNVGVPPAFNKTANTYREAKLYSGNPADAYPIANIKSILRNGSNVIAIQVHNQSISSSDLSLIPILTLGYKQKPNHEIKTSDVISLPKSFFHTNFKLSSQGENIILSDSLGNIIDQIKTGFIPNNFSYGRKPDGSMNWLYFSNSTPGKPNISDGKNMISEQPFFNLPSGNYINPIQVSLFSNQSNAKIRYTLDGSEPTENSNEFINSINITKSTVIRAKSFVENALPSQTATQTYFINENYNLPKISLATDPKHFFDNDSGIYVLGPNAESSYPYFNANFWQDWEKPINFEYFEKDNTAKVNSLSGVKIYGNWTRAFPQKSLAIYFRGKYGQPSVQYKFFPEKSFDEYQNIVLRNNGNDFQYTLLRDRFATELFKNLDINVQSTKQVEVFLNGNYWGIYTLREKINEDFIASNFNLNRENIDIVDFSVESGKDSNEHFAALYDFISKNDLSISANYEYVKTQMDIRNFINYQIAEIYCNNTDWPGNNVKLWRERTLNGKWSWIIYDIDFGFGLYNPSDYSFNTLEFATAENGPAWPNPSWSTLMLRKLLTNKEFQSDFASTFAFLLNTTFSSDSTLNLLSSVYDEIKNSITRHNQRWQGEMANTWENNVQVIRNFVKIRYLYMRAFVATKFKTTVGRLSLDVNDNSSGSVEIQSFPVYNLPHNGYYFKNNEISITAKPKSGYVFLRWEGIDSNLPEIKINLTQDTTIKAIFQKVNVNPNQVVINEINYNSNPNRDSGDWIEIVNNSSEKINLAGWKFTDSSTEKFILPAYELLPDSFLVIVKDSLKFNSIFLDVKNFVGQFDFGLSSSGEKLILYDNNEIVIDSLTYRSALPWPIEPNGQGSTLSLLNYNLDNSNSSNWAASKIGGTPGKLNDVFVTSLENDSQIPTDFSLYQNFPNPFNSTTTIRFSLRNESKVRLIIYNSLGEKIDELIDNYLSAGEHKIIFNADNLASGVYLYRLEAGEFTATKKLILLK